MNQYHPEDRPEASEQPIRARVPDHVARGAFSTGVIVMTAQSEMILDFVQNLGRPHQIVARVVMPHHVLPQLVDALQRNMELYRNRWGELPSTPVPQASAPVQPSSGAQPFDSPALQADPQSKSHPAQPVSQGGSGGASAGGAVPQSPAPPDSPHSSDAAAGGGSAGSGGGARQASAQEIYDDLKIRDELLSGAYANAVMIGHGPHEFSFDFITNFYPNSAVSARVFLAAGQVPRLHESLKGTWEQMRSRMRPPPGRPNQDPPEQPPYDDGSEPLS